MTYHVLLGRRAFRLEGDLGLLRETGVVSARAYLAVLLSFLVLRLDIALIQGMLGTSATGIYAVAVQVAELLLVLVDAIADARLRKPLTAWHCVLEFYSVATRLPGGMRLEPEHAGRLVAEEILTRFAICDRPASAQKAFVSSIVEERVAGGRVYDAHIAETARLAGAAVTRHGESPASHSADALRHPRADGRRVCGRVRRVTPGSEDSGLHIG